jgi:protein-S-isoprenylcysteine O-methyltransferase Ste14
VNKTIGSPTVTAPSIDSAPASDGRLPLPWIFRQRGILANLPLVFALFWTSGRTANATLAWSLGLSLISLGTAVRVWAQSHIHHHWDIPLRLTNSGPYQMVRNPLYIGNTLIIVGATVCSRLLWLAPVALVWCALVYSLVVRYEEKGLLKANGEPYRQYLAQVPRWLPRTLKHPNLVNQYTGKSILAEAHCVLVVLPFVLKDYLVFRLHF